MRHAFSEAMIATIVMTASAIHVGAASARRAIDQSTVSQIDVKTGGEQLLKGKDCFSCHAVDHKVVGPAYVEVARKYAGKPNSVDRLVRSIRDGETGTWGTVPMTSHPDIPDTQLREIANWILSLQNTPPPSAANAPEATEYSYKLSDGKTVKLDFRLFLDTDNQTVTKEVFRGYELFDSYCYRCHGQDATESELAPDLRRSLELGMTLQQFMSVAMAGREDKGMPSWAGFLTEAEAKDIFMYIQGRRLELVPVGRPRSEDQ